VGEITAVKPVEMNIKTSAEWYVMVLLINRKGKLVTQYPANIILFDSLYKKVKFLINFDY